LMQEVKLLGWMTRDGWLVIRWSFHPLSRTVRTRVCGLGFTSTKTRDESFGVFWLRFLLIAVRLCGAHSRLEVADWTFEGAVVSPLLYFSSFFFLWVRFFFSHDSCLSWRKDFVEYIFFWWC
jgi:hypothetical protein